MLFERISEDETRCLICPRLCILQEGQSGYCATRVASKGKIHTMIYGLVSSVSIDPIEKKPLFHFWPGSLCLSLGTYGCNFRCVHCQNWTIAHLKFSERKAQGWSFLAAEESVRIAREEGVRGIAWTYNEPTIWFEYTLDSARLARKEGLYTVYVTNGYITPRALELLSPYLDAYRVDLKGWHPSFWHQVAKIADPAPVFEAARLAKQKYGLHVEVVTNVIPTYNDDEETSRELAQWIHHNLGAETPWHITRFIPQLEFSHLPPTPTKTLERVRKIGEQAGLQFVYLGNIPHHPGEHTYCPNCHRLLIVRSGFSLIEDHLGKEKTCPTCGETIPIRGEIECLRS